jgi:hypothetical protein
MKSLAEHTQQPKEAQESQHTDSQVTSSSIDETYQHLLGPDDKLKPHAGGLSIPPLFDIDEGDDWGTTVELENESSRETSLKRDFEVFSTERHEIEYESHLSGSFQSRKSSTASGIRTDAYNSMLANLDQGTWTTIGLISTTDNHTSIEKDLGSNI